MTPWFSHKSTSQAVCASWSFRVQSWRISPSFLPGLPSCKCPADAGIAIRDMATADQIPTPRLAGLCPLGTECIFLLSYLSKVRPRTSASDPRWSYNFQRLANARGRICWVCFHSGIIRASELVGGVILSRAPLSASEFSPVTRRREAGCKYPIPSRLFRRGYHACSRWPGCRAGSSKRRGRRAIQSLFSVCSFRCG